MKWWAALVLLAAVASTTAQQAAPDTCGCEDVFDPVCGSDGNTYKNRCALECVAKTLDVPLGVAPAGGCTDTQPGKKKRGWFRFARPLIRFIPNLFRGGCNRDNNGNCQ